MALFPLLSLAPAGAAEPSLDLPDSPSGDVVVTASADATWPFLQVRLALPSDVHAPYESMRAIAPAPVANSGGDVPVDVPTWGVEGNAVFVLLGCASS